MKSIFVYNAKSGSALSKAELVQLMKKHSIHIDGWIPVDTHLDATLKRLLKTKSCVFVLGGDGTIRSVAAHIATTSSLLVPLPGGTLNHFTKDLAIKQDLDAALASFSSWREGVIDIASVNDHFFLNNSSIGVYAESLKSREALAPKLSKWPAALWGTIQNLVQFRVYTITVNERRYKTPLLFVGNNHYSLRSGNVGNRQSLDAGMLSVYIVKSQTRRSAFVTALSLIAHKKANVVEQKVTQCEIAMRRARVTVSLDGEKVELATPLSYQIHAASLRVLAP